MAEDDADDAERRQEEWTALLAIYGEDAVVGAPDALEWRVSLGERPCEKRGPLAGPRSCRSAHAADGPRLAEA